jgi:hypothetical protein
MSWGLENSWMNECGRLTTVFVDCEIASLVLICHIFSLLPALVFVIHLRKFDLKLPRSSSISEKGSIYLHSLVPIQGGQL